MYRVLIADDEAIIRDGIKCLFDFEALGFTFCGEAATGREAYEKMIDLQPDVVLLDIRMPEMSGLDAIKKAREEGFTGKVVIISSYSDFHYAQEAIRCDVQNYITKPIDEDELKEIFLTFRKQLENSADQAPQHAILPSLLTRTPVPVTQPCQVLLCESFDAEEPLQLQRLMQRLHITGTDDNIEYAQLQQFTVFLLKGKMTIQTFQELMNRGRQSQASFDDPLAPFFITYGAAAETFDDLCISYRNVCNLRQQRFFCPAGRHTLGSDTLRSASNEKIFTHAFLEGYARQLTQYVQTFNRKMTATALNELEDKILASGEDAAAVRLFFTDLYLQIKDQMNHLYPENTIPFYSNSHIIRTITDAVYLSDITCFLAQRFDMIMSAIGTTSRDSVLDDVLHYIHHNFAGNITLENIAPLFGYNHSYLGKIFRKKMGCSFNAYVDHVRIEKAKELLLQDDAKVYAISERVGYKNVDYFHVKFRKYVNQSPAEFRKANKEISCSPEENTQKGPLL